MVVGRIFTMVMVLGAVVHARLDVCPSLDFNILIDTSMDVSELEPALAAVKGLVKLLPLNRGGINMALFSTSDKRYRLQKLTDNKSQLFEKIADVKPTARGDVGAAFARIGKFIQADGRKGARRVLLVLSDALWPHPNTIYRNVVALRRANVTVLGVVMGTASSESQMAEVVSDPIQEHLFTSETDYYSADVLPGEIFLKLLTDVCVCPIGTRLLTKQCAPIEPRCDGQELEIAFMLDTSFSISDKQLVTLKRFIDRLTTKFRLGPKSQKIALLSLNRREPQILADLGVVQDSKALAAVLKKIEPTSSGSTPASKAMTMIKNNIFSRDGRRALVLLTDGVFNSFRQASKISDQLSESGIEIYAVGFEQAVRVGALSKITKTKKRIHLFKNSAAELSEVLDLVDEVSRQICGRKIPNDQPETTLAPSTTTATTDNAITTSTTNSSMTCSAPLVMHSKLVCEHRRMWLNCAFGSRIAIQDASYGRSNAKTCTGRGRPVKTSECHAKSSLAKVKAACEGKISCNILAKNHVFSDPCVGTFKYLVVDWSCMGKVKVACDRRTLGLRCSAGEKIKIIRASYGRTSYKTCRTRTSRMRSNNCRSSVALAKVKEACEGQNNCTIRATTGIFGDPCPGSYKYLEVEHECCSAADQNQDDDIDIETTTEALTTPATLPIGQCRKPRDVVMLVEWRSIAFAGMLDEFKDLARSVAATLDVSAGVRLHFIEYGHAVHHLTGLSELKDNEQVADRINAWNGSYGAAGLLMRGIGAAMDQLRTSSPDLPDYILVITGGLDSAPAMAAKTVREALGKNVTVIGVVVNSFLKRQAPPAEANYIAVKKLFNGEAPDSVAALSDKNMFVYSAVKATRERDYKSSFLRAVSRRVCGIEEQNQFSGVPVETVLS